VGQDAVVVDFDSVGGNIPAFDLVYLLATFWTPAQRREHEDRCLRVYHDALGARAYDFDALLGDYEAMIAFMVFDAVADIVRGSLASYWEPKLRCLVAAYRDQNV
jgi:aminoglycoside phosphotransferase (APT) family kinase protein